MSSDEIAARTTGAVSDAGPLGALPRIHGRQAQLANRVSRLNGPIEALVAWLSEPTGVVLEIGHPEVQWRASGLARPGVIAQLAWPRLATRVGLGIETSLAHGLVDRLLGFERFPGEERLQVTPVEWGILTFALSETLNRLAASDGPLGPWDLTIDRVGPDPFDPQDLGPMITVRWPLRVGAAAGSARLWLAESLVTRWLIADGSAVAPDNSTLTRFGDLASGIWRAEAATCTLARGLGRLRPGGVLPIDGGRLRGTVKSPTGPVRLTLQLRDTVYYFDADAAPLSGGGRLVLKSSMRCEPSPREPISVTPSTDPTPAAAPAPSTPSSGTSAPADIPVTLTVELGKLSLTVSRLAELKPGDVLELGRHAREPVELTSGGRLVARGELVQIDTELGVRVLNMLL